MEAIKVWFYGGIRMNIKFLENVNINDNLIITKDTILEAKRDGDNIMIRLPDDRTIVSPKTALVKIYEII